MISSGDSDMSKYGYATMLEKKKRKGVTILTNSEF